MEIASVVAEMLAAVVYLHAAGKIHRDIKAGNVLLTQNGEIKLADFGSASTKTPTTSFIGTPFWMAPELIMAMEDGTYSVAVDVWSLGITCIELAETAPPLFHMHAMSALYHIPQRDAPRLEGDKYSSDFKGFVAACLQKDPIERASAEQALKHDFLNQRSSDALSELVLRLASTAVDQNGAGSEDSKTTPLGVAEVVMPERAEPKGSKDTPNTSGTTSPESTPSSPAPPPKQGHTPTATPVQVAPPARPSSYIEIAGEEDDDQGLAAPADTKAAGSADTLPPLRGSSSPGKKSPITPRRGKDSSPGKKAKKKKDKKAEIEHSKSVLQLARTTRASKQQGNLENQLILLQMKQIRKIRKEQAKALEAMEAKHESDTLQWEHKNSKEFDALMRSHEKELDKFLARKKSEMDQWGKEDTAATKKFSKRQKEWRDKETSEHSKMCSQNLKTAMQAMKQDTADLPRDQRKLVEKDVKERQEKDKKQSERDLKVRLETEHADAELKFRATQLEGKQVLEMSLETEEVVLATAHRKQLMAIKATKSVAFLEKKQQHLKERADIDTNFLKKLVETELEQAASLQKESTKALDKSHSADLKLQPKEIKSAEQKIKKEFTGTVKVTERKFRSSFKQLSKMKETPEVLKEHQEEKTSTLTQLESQYRASVDLMIKGRRDTMSAKHKQDSEKLEQENTSTLQELQSYQNIREESHQHQQQADSDKLKKLTKSKNRELKKEIAADEQVISQLDARLPELKNKHAEGLQFLLKPKSLQVDPNMIN